MKLILIFFIFSIFQTVPSSAVPDVEMRIKTLEKQMSKRMLDLERELIFLKAKDSRAIERLNELDSTVRRQHDEITTLQERCQKLQRTEESIYSYEVPDSQHVGTIRDDRNGTSEKVVDTDSDKSTMRRSFVLQRAVSATTTAFYAYMSGHESSPGSHHTLIFGSVITNIGDHYNRYTGIFTAAIAGIYVFSYSITPGIGAYIPVEIVRNNGVVGSSMTRSYGGYQHNAASTVIIQLSVGDVCFIRTSSSSIPSSNIYSGSYARSSFSGWLLA